MRAPTLLLLSCAFALPAQGADDPAAWRPWVEDAEAPVTTPDPVFPDRVTLDKLRRDGAWLERWAAPPPSLAWGDVVHSLLW